MTQVRITEGWEPKACPCDHSAKQSYPAWWHTACAAGKSHRKACLSSCDLVGWLAVLELKAAHENAVRHLHWNLHFSRGHGNQNDWGLSHGHFPSPNSIQLQLSLHHHARSQTGEWYHSRGWQRSDHSQPSGFHRLPSSPSEDGLPSLQLNCCFCRGCGSKENMEG